MKGALTHGLLTVDVGKNLSFKAFRSRLLPPRNNRQSARFFEEI